MNWNDEQIAAIEQMGEESIPRIEASRMVISAIEAGRVDAQMCLQIGAALLLDKPLIVTVFKGSWIPARLRQLADAVIEGDSMQDPEVQEKLQAAIRKVMAKRMKA